MPLPHPGFRAHPAEPMISTSAPSWSDAIPRAGQMTAGASTRGLASWGMIRQLWHASGAPLTISSWTIAPRIAAELVAAARHLPLDLLVLDRSTASRNSALSTLQELRDKLRLIGCHAKVASCEPYTWIGSGNLSDSRGHEAWVCVHDVELARRWAAEIRGWE